MGNDIRFSTGLEVLGVWPSSSVQFEHVYPGVFNLDIDGEDWVLSTSDPAGLISTLPKRAFSPAVPGTPPDQPVEDPQRGLTEHLRSWFARQATVGVSPTTFALALLVVFLLGYLIGRSPGRGVALAVFVMAALAALAGIVRVRLNRRHGERTYSLLPRRKPEEKGNVAETAEHQSEPEVTAKRLAEVLERFVATGEHSDTIAERSSVSVEPLPAEAAGASFADEIPSVDNRTAHYPKSEEPHQDEDHGATVVFLDAHGRVVGRGEEGLAQPDRSTSVHPRNGHTGEIEENEDPISTFSDSHQDLIDPVSHRLVEGVGRDSDPVGDDLELIRGIGPVYAEALANLGLGTFEAIAALNDEDIQRIEEEVGPIRARMRRHRWREHAKALADASGQSEDEGNHGAAATTTGFDEDSNPSSPDHLGDLVTPGPDPTDESATAARDH